MAERNYFTTGITELLILSILNDHDSYAYEITKTIEQNSNSLLSISLNTIYTATYMLKDEGKISEYSQLVGTRRTRIYYHIEEKGIAYLEQLKDNYQQTIAGVQAILETINIHTPEEGMNSNGQD